MANGNQGAGYEVGGSELVPGWTLARLADICSKPQYGWTTSARGSGDGLHLLRTTDISSGQIDWATVPRCDQDPPEPQKFLLRPGDIVVSRAGSVGLSCLVGQCPPAVFASYLIRLRPRDKVDARFIARFLQSPDYWRQVSEGTSGNSIPNFNASKLADITVPLPPLAEQRRIGAKIEELLAHVNAARKRLARVPTILKRFRQSVLAAACSGALVPEQRDREATTLGELSARITSGSRDWKPFYTPEGPSTFVLTQNIRPLRFDPKRYQGVAPPPDHRDCERSRIMKDDLLVTIVGANTGDSCRIALEFTDYFVCQSVALVRLRDRRHSRFLELWLNSPLHGLRQLAERVYGEGRPHLGLADLGDVEVAIPGMDEQAEIVRRAEAFLALADTIEQRVDAATARAERLTQSILAKAFRGELVPTTGDLSGAMVSDGD